MNARERVKRTLEFDGPDRVPRQLWVLPWAADHHAEALAAIQTDYPDDMVSPPAAYKEPLPGVGDRYAPGTCEDDWGCTFVNIQKGAIGEVKEPLLKDWQDVDKVRVPVERLSLDVEAVDAYCRESELFTVMSCFPRPFEQLQFIRGTENLMLDLMDQPEEFFVLLKRMHEFYLKEFEVWASTDVDALFIMDDWGSQTAMLISPKLWREIFKPLYKDYIDLAHRKGKYILMHSDGHILEILPDLVEMGLHGINSQVFCMGLEELSARFKGKITFWGELDRQRILPEGTRDEVFAAVAEMKRTLYANGGLIAQCEFGLGAKPENVRAFFEAFGG